MAYLVAADFRKATLTDATIGLALSDAEATDAQLTTAIARMSNIVDRLTDDHFEPQAAVTLILTGGTERLWLPRRIRTATSVAVLQTDGTWATQATSDYVVMSSINPPQTSWQDVDLRGDIDRIEVAYGQSLSTGDTAWPSEHGRVRVIGDFGWPQVHPDIARAVALMVWDHFKPNQDMLRRAIRYATVDLQVEYAGPPTGIPEANAILARMRRIVPVGVW